MHFPEGLENTSLNWIENYFEVGKLKPSYLKKNLFPWTDFPLSMEGDESKETNTLNQKPNFLST